MNRESTTAVSFLATIGSQIEATRAIVNRIAASVLADSNLENEVVSLTQTSTAIRAKLAGLASDERDCLTMLDEIAGDGLLRLTAGQDLTPEAAERMRQRLRRRLINHQAAIRRNRTTLERGIETCRAGMRNRFATFAVAGLMQEEEAPADRACAFVVAYLVASHLKDRLETAGYRWAGEKTLISLYLNAVGCERRKSKERFVADPIASIIASALHFVSARELHQSLYQMHMAMCEESLVSAAAPVAFVSGSGDAFDLLYRKTPTAEETFWELIDRARRRPVPLTAHRTSPPRPAA